MSVNIDANGIAELVSSLTLIGVGVLIFMCVVAYWLIRPAIFEKWIGIIAAFLSVIFHGLKKFSIKKEFQGRINNYVKELGAHTSIEIPNLRIHFATDGQSEDFVWEENSAILVMHDRKHHNRNFVHAAHFYTSEILLRRSKLHLSKTQKEALDLFSTQQVLRNTYRSAEEQFVSGYVIPSIERNEDIRGLLAQFDFIAKKGLYFSILIQELTYLGHKVFLQKPTTEVIEEVKSLISFLHRYSMREDGDTVTSEDFWGKYMRCAVKVVASVTTREKGSTHGHKERICRAVRNGFENIYVIGANTIENRAFMSRVVDAVMDECPDLEEGTRRNLQGRIRKGRVFKNVDTYFIPLHNPGAVKYFFSEEDLEDAEAIEELREIEEAT